MSTPTGPRQFYRQHTPPIMAVQWLGDNAPTLAEFIGTHHCATSPPCVADHPSFFVDHDYPLPHTGQLWVAKARTYVPLTLLTWVVAEQDGSGFYPCQADVFAASYTGNRPDEPLLGLATTRLLLEEIGARMRTTQNSDKGRQLGLDCEAAIENLGRGVLEYRTVGG